MNNDIFNRAKTPFSVAFLLAAALMASGCSSNSKDKVQEAIDEVIMTDYEKADGIKGGQLYSKFWVNQAGSKVTSSSLDNTEWDKIDTSADFFRCKQCHGWDRLGREGGYSDRGPKPGITGRPNVSAVNLAQIAATTDEDALFAKIKRSTNRRDLSVDLSAYDPADTATSADGDMMPDYSQLLTDAQIWNIVKFLKVEALDTTALYTISFPDGGVYPNRARAFSDIGSNGDAANGDTIFASNCAGCHGADGTGGSVGLVDGAEYTVGRHVRAKPYEDQHKVKFGHLGSSMTPILKDAPLSDIKDLLVALTDTTKYPDEVPAETPNETPAIDGAALFVSNCGGCHTGNGMGSGGSGNVSGASVALIKSKIASVGVMAQFASLSDDELQAISDAL